MKNLNIMSEFQLHLEANRLRELIQINREKAQLAIDQKLGRKALSILDIVEARQIELKAVNAESDKRFNI
tara:strand:+ start:2401 stop:2610 length:210 start_codon:yes stop_codon:yes gene_type:complete